MSAYLLVGRAGYASAADAGLIGTFPRMGDDFDQLGAAVARVLRDAFVTAEELRREGAADARSLAESVAAEVEQSLRGAMGLQSQVRSETEGLLDSVRSTVTSASGAVEAIVRSARAEADELRAGADAEVRSLVDQARGGLARAVALSEAEHVRFEHSLAGLTEEVRTAVAAVEAGIADRRQLLLERTKAEAAAILRQARLHHRAVAAEADRMLEAAAADAAAMRQAGREDALKIAHQMSGVVSLPAARSARTA
jgi:hypothetical protein